MSHRIASDEGQSRPLKSASSSQVWRPPSAYFDDYSFIAYTLPDTGLARLPLWSVLPTGIMRGLPFLSRRPRARRLLTVWVAASKASRDRALLSFCLRRFLGLGAGLTEEYGGQRGGIQYTPELEIEELRQKLSPTK